MKLFTGHYERQYAKVPYVVKTKIMFREAVHVVTFDEDIIYVPSKLQLPEWGKLLSRTAKAQAEAYADNVMRNGVEIDSTYYPVHKINYVELLKAKWVEVEKEVVVKKWEVQIV